MKLYKRYLFLSVVICALIQYHNLIGANTGLDTDQVQLQRIETARRSIPQIQRVDAKPSNAPSTKSKFNLDARKKPQTYPPADKPITHLLNGTLMHEVKSCPIIGPLKPENIHIVSLASPYYFQEGNPYQFGLQTVKFYADLHGYPYQIVNPVDVMKVHGHIRPDDPGGEIICAKSLVMLYKLREIYHYHGCHAKWVVFLDADVTMIDLTRSLESLIGTANTLYGGVDKKCSVIAQLSPGTINTGVLLFRVNPAGEKVLSKWVDVHRYHANRGRAWVTDQGWFQYVYLLHLEHHYNRKLFFDCAVDLKSVPGFVVPPNSQNGIRNNCYAKNWHLYNLWGEHLERQQHHQQREAYANHTIDSVTDTAVMAATTGIHHNNPIIGSKYCMLEGVTTEDRFNMHDCNGEKEFNPSTGEFVFVPETGKLVQSTNKNGKKIQLPELSICKLQGNLMYHGKEFDLIKSRIQPNWEKMMERARELLSGTTSNEGSVHLFPMVERADMYQSCNETLQRMLHVDAVKDSWLPPSWKKIESDFYAEIRRTTTTTNN